MTVCYFGLQLCSQSTILTDACMGSEYLLWFLGREIKKNQENILDLIYEMFLFLEQFNIQSVWKTV